MMATFTLFLLQLDDSAQLLIGSYYDSSVTTKKKATSRSPRFQTSPGAAKLTIETSKGKRKRRRRDRDHQQQQQQQLDSSGNTAKTTIQGYCARPVHTDKKHAGIFFLGKLPDTRLPVEPRFYPSRLSSANTIYPDWSGSTRGRTDGRTDGRLPDRPQPLSFFCNLLLNKLPLYLRMTF